MKNRRAFLMAMTSGLVALAVLAGPVIADELFGVIVSVDVAGKSLQVLPKDADKEIQVKVTDDTEVISKKGTSKIDLEKLSAGIQKAKVAGKKGRTVMITHEKGVASKIDMRKKAEEPKTKPKAE